MLIIYSRHSNQGELNLAPNGELGAAAELDMFSKKKLKPSFFQL
jgi:hypothetical protein